MKPSRTTLIRIVLAAVGLIALAGPVSAASAGGFTLSLTASSTPVVGTPMILHAAGTIPPPPPGDLAFSYWFSLDAIPTTVTSTCPPDRWEGAQFANSNGSIVVLTQLEVPDAAGNFSIPVAVTPSAPGSVLLCAYTDDGAAATLAAASLTLNIQPKQSTGTGAPQSTGTGAPQSTGSPQSTGTGSPASIPTQVRRGIRSCLALLGRKAARSCVQSIARRANRACRRLHRPSGRTACLHAVRKIATRYS